MMPLPPPLHLARPGAPGPRAYPARLRALLGRRHARLALEEISTWPGYRPSPLRALRGLAAGLGLGEVWCKDESERFGLGSFKALGGAYAVLRLLEERLRSLPERPEVAAEGLIAGRFRHLTEDVTVCCASAGNHGRSVAWGARLFGCRCVVYLPASTHAARAEAIAALGARVVRVEGTYDRAVRRAAADAAARGWWVVSDTAYAGYTEVPLTVMRGYLAITEEIAAQWGDGPPPTHLFVQCGVGGLAAAMCAGLWAVWGERRPRVVVVEPEAAPCMLHTARAGRPTAVAGDLDTAMSCLACGEVSTVAWEVLREGADHFVAVADAHAHRAVEVLGRPAAGDPALPTAPSGAAGVAGVLAAATDPEVRTALGLDAGSRVLTVVSEGVAGTTSPQG